MPTRPAGVSPVQLPVLGTDGVHAPRLGALVRLFYDTFRSRLVHALQAHGYEGITQTELMFFSGQGPEGARPIELAQRCHMSKQSMNYVLTHMERSGYVERRAADQGENRRVHLTARGWKLYRLLLRTIDDVHGQWSAKIGKRRFDAMLDALEEIVLAEQAMRGDEPPRVPPRRRSNGTAPRVRRAS